MVKKMKIRINKEFIFFMTLLVPIFEPQIFTQFVSTTIIYIILNIIEFFYLLLKANNQIPKLFFFWIFIRLYLLVICLLNNNFSGILNFGYLSLQVANLILLFYFCYKRKKIQVLVEGIAIISFALLFINFVTLVFFENGIIPSSYWDNHDNDIYFLGIKTKILYYIFPAIASSIAIKNSSKRKKWICLNLIVSIFNIFAKNVSTGIIFLLGLLVIYILRNKKNLNPCALILIGFGIQFGIVFFKVYNLFSFIIVDILHKSMNLSSRVYIWNNAIDFLKNANIFNQIFGHGIFKGYAYVLYDSSVWQPHSQILDLLASGGMIGTILMISFLCFTVSKILKNNKTLNMLLLISFLIVILSSVELYFTLAVCYTPFILIYYLSKEGEFKNNG